MGSRARRLAAAAAQNRATVARKTAEGRRAAAALDYSRQGPTTVTVTSDGKSRTFQTTATGGTVSSADPAITTQHKAVVQQQLARRQEEQQIESLVREEGFRFSGFDAQTGVISFQKPGPAVSPTPTVESPAAQPTGTGLGTTTTGRGITGMDFTGLSFKEKVVKVGREIKEDVKGIPSAFVRDVKGLKDVFTGTDPSLQDVLIDIGPVKIKRGTAAQVVLAGVPLGKAGKVAQAGQFLLRTSLAGRGGSFAVREISTATAPAAEREIIGREDFGEIFRTGKAAEETDVGFFKGLVSEIPFVKTIAKSSDPSAFGFITSPKTTILGILARKGAKAVTSESAFQESIKTSFADLGFTPEETDVAVSAASRQRIGGDIGEGVGTLIAGAQAEELGRKTLAGIFGKTTKKLPLKTGLFTKAKADLFQKGFRGTFIPGVGEGLGIIEAKAVSEYRTPTFKERLFFGVAGGLSAGTISGTTLALAPTSPTLSKFVLGSALVTDPLETFSDILTTVATGTGGKGSVITITSFLGGKELGFTTTPTTPTVPTKPTAPSAPTTITTQISVPTKPITTIKTPIITPTTIPSIVSVPTRGRTTTPTIVPIIIPPITPPVTPVIIPVITPPVVPVIVPAITPPTIPTLITVPTITTGSLLPLIPLLPGGAVGPARKGFAFGKRRRTKYTPNLGAILKGVRGKRPSVITGVGFRPLAPTKKKAKKKRKKKR